MKLCSLLFCIPFKRENRSIQDDGSIELLQKTHGETTVPLVRKSTRTGTYRQVLLTALVTPIMISLAHVLSYPALIGPQLRKVNANDTLYMDKDDGSWYTSISSLCAPFGSLMAGVLMDRYGRKVALATPLIPMILAWILTATATSCTTLFTARVLLGIFGGFGPPICQIYLAESADSDFRGIILNVGYVSLSFGFLLTFALGAVINWQYLAWIGCLIPMITISGFFILPETPVYLCRNGHIERAYNSLLWLRGDANIARNELNEHLSRLNQEKDAAAVQNGGNSESSMSFRDFLQPAVLKPIVIIFGFILFFNLSGTYLIIYYAIDILSQVDLIVSAEYASAILSVVRLIVTIGFCWLFMHVKRRMIYLLAGIGSSMSTLCLAGYLFTRQYLNRGTSSASATPIDVWISGLLLLIYVSTSSGFLIAPGFLTGELLPAKIRGRLAGYIYTYFSIVTFVLNKFFPQSNEYIGLCGVLLVFGMASVITTALVFCMVPETKGISLLEIEQHFQTNGWIYSRKRKYSSQNTN